MTAIETLRTATGQIVELQRHDDDDAYYMHGPTGSHTLAISETSDERLAAHWGGFCSMNDVTNDAQRRSVADPKLVEASDATTHELRVATYLLELLRARIEGAEAVSLNYGANWTDHGEAVRIVKTLADYLDPDGERGLVDEICDEVRETAAA